MDSVPESCRLVRDSKGEKMELAFEFSAERFSSRRLRVPPLSGARVCFSAEEQTRVVTRSIPSSLMR